MSGTRKRTPYNIYSKERKPQRHAWLKKLRRRAHMDVAQGKEPERERRTSGWLTW